MARSTSNLVLQVDAVTDPFTRAIKAGKTSLAELGQASAEMAEEVNRNFQELTQSPVDAARAMEKAMTTAIQNTKRQASAILSSGSTNALGGFTADGAGEAADAMARLAASERARAAAAGAVTAADEREAAMLRVVQTSATAAAAALDEQTATLRSQQATLQLVEDEMERMGAVSTVTSNTVTAGHNRMGVSGQLMMHSVRSASDSFAAGLPPATIFAEQIGRVAEAAAYSEGALGAFGEFMAGPWGIAVVAGTSILASLIGHMDLFKDKAVENAKALDEVKAGDDGLSEAQKVLGEMFDLTTGKLQNQNEMLRLNARLTAEKLRAEALSDKATADKTLGTATGWQHGLSMGTLAQGLVANVLPGSAGNVGDEMNRAQQLNGRISGLRSGKVSREDALKWAEGFNFDGLTINRQTFAQALIGQVEAEQKTKTADLIDQSLDSDTLAPGLRKEGKEKRARAPKKDPTPANDGAYDQLWDKLDGDAASVGRQNLTSIEAKAVADRDKVTTDLQKELDQIASQGRQHDWSKSDIKDAQDYASTIADQKQDEISAKEKRDLTDRDLDQQQQALAVQDMLLGLQGELSTNLKERRDIALQMLANEKQAALLGVQRDVNSGHLTGDAGAKKVADINTEYGLKGQQANRQNAGPLQSYQQQLQGSVGDMNTAMQGVEVDGIKGVSDGLVGIISNTENASQAFKRMATSIIADLARIGVEKLILSGLGLAFSTGGAVQAHADGGAISGPGTGRSDSILARLSNGEFVVNAAATSRNLPLLHAINNNKMPAFADGGFVGGAAMSSLSYPGLPSAQSVRPAGMTYAPYIDVRGAVVTQDILDQANQMAQYHATHAASAALAAAPDMSVQKMTRINNNRIP